jgi:hypothetical protein
MFTRYMLLAVEQRQKIDQRTIGDLFYLMVPELSDLPYYEALCHIMRQFADFVQQHALLDEQAVQEMLDIFCGWQADSIEHIGYLPCAKFEILIGKHYGDRTTVPDKRYSSSSRRQRNSKT